MQVTIRLGEPITRAVGALRISLIFDDEQATVADVLQRLASEYPGFEAAFRGDDIGHSNPYRVYVNARQVAAGQEGQWLLTDGDKVYIFLPAAGGQDMPLPQAFYARSTLVVARDLLGRRLVRYIDSQRLGGRITEVEAYIGEDDLASHAARGKTNRNAECTPGYYNFEGESNRRQDGNYNGGFPKYYSHLGNVREHFDEYFRFG